MKKSMLRLRFALLLSSLRGASTPAADLMADLVLAIETGSPPLLLLPVPLQSTACDRGTSPLRRVSFATGACPFCHGPFMTPTDTSWSTA